MRDQTLQGKSCLTKEPTIAETSPSACKCSTILLLCVGSTRANNLALMHAALCSSDDKSSNSRPVYDNPSVDSFSPKTPILLQIASAVACNMKSNLIYLYKH